MLSFKEIQEKIEREIGQLEFDCPPKSLYEPITYILSLGGKRIRPALVLMAYNLYREDVEKAIRPAIGLEVFHNFTLLHDDLMDQADKRRSKPTVHKVWNANTAILSGDAMLIAAYQLIGETAPEHLKEVLDLFTRTALEICGGQQYDMEFESRMDVSEEEYLEMIRLKTAVLLACSLKTGAILGGASREDAENLYRFGINIGLAFQLQDDLLDLYGDEAKFGKKLGSDIRENKKTYLYIKALELLEEVDAIALEHEFSTPTLPFGDIAKIKKVKALYEKVKVKDHCEKAVGNLFAEAGEALDRLSASPAVDPQALSALRAFGSELLGREV